MNERRCCAFSCVVVCVCLCCLPLAGEGTSTSPSLTPGDVKELLVRAYESSTSVVRNVRLAFEMRETHDPQWAEETFPGDKEWKEPSLTRWEYTRKGDKERLDDLSDQSLPQAGHPVWICDGQRELVYYPTRGTGDTEAQIGRAHRSANKQGLMAKGMAPVKLIAYQSYCSPATVLNNPEARIETKTEKVGGLMTYKISCRLPLNGVIYPVTFWLSPERSGLPVRMEIKDTTGVLRKVMETKRFMKVSDGVWFPREVIHRDIDSEGGKSREIGTHVYTVKDLERNPMVDDTTFLTETKALPKGTIFQDQESGKQITIGEKP